MIRPFTTLATAATLACALAGTGGSPSYVYAHPRVAGALPAPAAAGCRTAQLTIAPVGSDAGLGHVGIMFAFRNTSTRTCLLHGYPGAQLLNAARRPLPTTVLWHRPGYLAGNQPLRLVVLAPGAAAYAVIEWDHGQAPGQSCPPAPYVLITPPNTYRSRLVALGMQPIDACGGVLTATPVEPTRFGF